MISIILLIKYLDKFNLFPEYTHTIIPIPNEIKKHKNCHINESI